MTTGDPRQSVLVLGKSQRVLDDTIAGLRTLGYTAQGTNDFFSDIPGRFDVKETDLVVFGGAIPPDRKAELSKEIAVINPQVIFLQSLIGIPGVIISQVQAAFNTDRQDPARAPGYTTRDRSIRLTLAHPADVKVTAWWRTSIVPPDPESASLVLLDDRLATGDHAIPVPAQVFRPPRRSPHSPNLPPAAFATVQIDAAIYAFSIAAGDNPAGG